MSKYVPNTNKLLVKPVELEDEKRSVIIRPDTVDDGLEVRYAQVVAAGARVVLGDHGSEKVDVLDIVPGDYVVLSKYGGATIEIDGVAHLVVSYDDVLLKKLDTKEE